MRLTRAQARKLGIAAGPARATVPRRDVMNGTERLYAQHLDLRIHIGEVVRYDFESMRLRLADDTWYTPDFAVYCADGTLEFHEVKGGYIRDDAMVKFKVASEKYPFPFVMAQYSKRSWKFRRLEPKKR